MKKNYIHPSIVVVTINSHTSLLAGSPQLYKDTDTNSTDKQLSRRGDFWEDEE